MYARRRALSAGAVLTAAAAIVLSGSPAQADCSLTDESAASTADWQVGATLGNAPVQLTGTGGLPALLLSELPQGSIAVRDVNGRNLVRLNATTTSAATETARLPDTFPQGLNFDPITGVRVLETGRTGAAKATPRATVDQAAQHTAPAVRANSSGRREVLRADDGGGALGGQFAWVPIEGIGLLGSDGAGLPWAAGIALLALAGGTAAVTVVARGHRATG